MHFDNQALEWDKDPQKVERAEIFAKEINDFIHPDNKMSAMEFGCGTGLLSFKLKDNFKSIILVDNSEGMINVLKEKIDKGNIKNFTPLKIDLFDHEIPLPKIDVIYTLMTLHHMTDINKTLKVFNSTLASNGYLCVADLVKEDGSFHSHLNDFDGHNGFDKDELSEKLEESGFKVVYYKECYVIEKKMGAKIKKYPLFLMICKKQI
ncbi:class I SAM-dependent methyltransferase [Carboxylicivirga caseinilyticus]|uniref:class I SAM-dependent methyltransferase n=1 Tax=Carboxylicivirga caseinilyticus TaxID=3417572 RepID=UPI003D33EF36|nr:methyltransferase domain-containing protein [Marinilabiliaceae bacterium A049]